MYMPSLRHPNYYAMDTVPQTSHEIVSPKMSSRLRASKGQRSPSRVLGKWHDPFKPQVLKWR